MLGIPYVFSDFAPVGRGWRIHRFKSLAEGKGETFDQLADSFKHKGRGNAHLRKPKLAFLIQSKGSGKFGCGGSRELSGVRR